MKPGSARSLGASSVFQRNEELILVRISDVCRLRRVGIRCPEPIMLRKHLLLMSFIGENQVPAQKLKDACLTDKEWETAYKQTYNVRNYN